MTETDIQNLESYFKTDNPHWNHHVFTMLCALVRENAFEKPEQALNLFDRGINILMQFHASPLNVIEEIERETENSCSTPGQRLFIYSWIIKYLRQTEFDFDTGQVHALLDIKQKGLMIALDPPRKKVDLREALKIALLDEIELLPATLKDLRPNARLTIICKLLPLLIPRTESIEHS